MAPMEIDGVCPGVALPEDGLLGKPFRCERVGPSDDQPQRRIYIALHNDYSEDFVSSTDLSEDECGHIAVRRLLHGGRGHFGPLEHAHLTVALRVDHNTMVQLRTHRVASFDVQSNRYTGQRFIDVAEGRRWVGDEFHFRPPGRYSDRQGGPYDWSDLHNKQLALTYRNACHQYRELRQQGVAEEHARQVLPGAYMQNMVITMNARMWLHVLDVRLKPDAQQEMRWAMELLVDQVKRWIPEIAAWWVEHRQGKGRLAP